MSNQSKSLLNKPLAIDPILHAQSGAIASALSTIMLYPIENIKLRQTFMKKQQTSEGQSPNTIKEQKVLQLVQDIYQKEGPCGFYKGFSALLTGNVLSYGIYFFWYELTKKFLKLKDGDLKASTLASLISGSATSVGTNPFWVVNTRMALQQTNQSFLATMLQMIKKEGFQSLYKGQLASLLLVINPIIQFTIYEFLKSKIQTKKFQFLLYFIAGAISKIIATLFTYPPQLLRTHSHMQKGKEQKQGYIKLAQKLFKEEGIYGLYRGVEAKMLQSVLNSAFMLAFYESIFKSVKFSYLQLNKSPQPKQQ